MTTWRVLQRDGESYLFSGPTEQMQGTWEELARAPDVVWWCKEESRPTFLWTPRERPEHVLFNIWHVTASSWELLHIRVPEACRSTVASLLENVNNMVGPITDLYDDNPSQLDGCSLEAYRNYNLVFNCSIPELMDPSRDWRQDLLPR